MSEDAVLAGAAAEHSVALVVVWPSERSVNYYRREGFEASDSLQLSLMEDWARSA